MEASSFIRTRGEAPRANFLAILANFPRYSGLELGFGVRGHERTQGVGGTRAAASTVRHVYMCDLEGSIACVTDRERWVRSQKLESTEA
jgi:hypothetical protein